MKNAYSVGQVNRYVKNMFTQDFFLQSAENGDGCTFPCTVYSKKRKQFSFFHTKAQIIYRFYFAKAFIQMTDFNDI